MANDLKSAGGAAQSPGGTNENEGQDNQNTSEKPSTVTRDAYEKALSQLKKAQERLAAKDADDKKREEAKLAQDQEWKKLADLRTAEAEEWKKKYTDQQEQITEGRKLNAVLGKLPGKVANDYWNLIDLEQIAVDPETGKIDEASVARYAKEFEAKHSRLIDKPAGGKIPGDAPKGAMKDLGFEAEIRKATNQREFDAVLKKYGKV